MRIIISTRDRNQLVLHEKVRDHILKLRPEAEVMLFCGERDASAWTDSGHVHYCFRGLAGFEREHRDMSDAEIAMAIARSALPATLYKGDPRFYYGEASERTLAIEQLYLGQEVARYLEEKRPEFGFVGAAGHLVWTVVNQLANDSGIPSYRLLDLAHWNPGKSGVRYWFLRNFEGRLSTDPADDMGWPAEDMRKHVEALVGGIESQEYKLDARSHESRRFFLSQSRKDVAHDLWLAFQGNQRAKARLNSARNLRKNAALATAPEDLPRPYVLFPLNLPADQELILRAPQYKDILSPCEQIAHVLPYGYVLALKEHPKHPGMLDHDRVRILLQRYPNVRLLPNDLPIHGLLKDAAALVTINSSSAIDALVCGVPVITIGEAFWKGTGVSYDVEYLLHGPEVFKQAMLNPKAPGRRKSLMGALSRLLQESFPGPGITRDGEGDDYLHVQAEAMIAKSERYVQQRG